jgi:hypothetical protein
VVSGSEDVLIGLVECDRMLDLYGESGDPDALAWIAYALAMKTRWLLRAGLSDQAITTSDELISHVERETDPAALGTPAEMLLNAGTCLADPAALASRRPRAKRLTPVIRICLANIDLLFNIAEQATVRRRQSLQIKGTGGVGGGRAGRKRRAEQALRIFDLLGARFGDATDVPARTLMVKARVRRAVILVQLGQIREAKAAFKKLLANGEAMHEVLTEIINHAEQRDVPHTGTEFATAFLASAADIELPRSRIETLIAANKVLERRQHDKPPLTRFTAWWNRRDINAALSDTE